VQGRRKPEGSTSGLASVASQVVDGQREAANVLVEKTYCCVARIAQKATHAVMVMVVIDAKILEECLFVPDFLRRHTRTPVLLTNSTFHVLFNKKLC
jgi:hypothetical protein